MRGTFAVETPASQKPILLIEDSPVDALTVLKALERAQIRNPVHHCTDGLQALTALTQDDPDGQVRPSIIILDLGLPGLSGGELLARIKSNETLRHIPVIVLSSQEDRRAVQDAYANGANCFIQKPMSPDKTVRTLKEITTYWFDIAELPC